MLEKFLNWSTGAFRHPVAVILIAVVVTVGSALGLRSMKFDNNVRTMIPADNRDLLINDYYENNERFGDSSLIFLGVEAKDVYDPKVLGYIQTLEARLEGLNIQVPTRLTAEALGLTPGESQRVVEAVRTMGVTPENYEEVLVPVLTRADHLVSQFGWDQAFAQKVATAAARVAPEDLFFDLSAPLNRVKSILSSDSITNEDDAVVVRKLLEADTIDQGAAEHLKKTVEGWSVYQGTLVSQDNTLTTLLLEPSNKDAVVRRALLAAVGETVKLDRPDGVTVVLDGEPVIENNIGEFMIGDLQILMPLVALVVVLILYLCFRNVAGVLYPVALMVVAVATSVGIMSWLQIPITVVAAAMPVLLVAIASAYGIHQMNHYFLDPSHDTGQILVKNMSTVGLAITLSGITVMVGFGALVTTAFVPIKNFGIFTAVGDVFALGAALWLLPALLMLSKKPKSVFTQESDTGFFSKVLHLFVRWNGRHSGKILVGAAALTVVFFVGCFFVESEMNTVAFFKKDSDIHRADDRLNEKLAGTQVINFILDSNLSDVLSRKAGDTPETRDLVQPEIMKKIDQFAIDVQREFPAVQKVMSINDIMKKMNQEMNGGDPAQYVISHDPTLISQYFLMISQDSLKDVISPNHDMLRISLQMKKTGTAEVEKIRDYANRYFSEDYLKTNHMQMQVTGVGRLYYVANELLVDGNTESIVVCVAIVFVLLIIVLRSVLMSLVALTPIAMTLAINFGLLGWFHIPLNIGTAMVSSVAIGIGVDYSIHFITWYRAEIRQRPDISSALERSVLHKGRAILYNMIVIVGGFAVLLVSRFVPLIQFGALVSVCMVTTGLGALVVVPALIKVLSRWNLKFLYLRR